MKSVDDIWAEDDLIERFYLTEGKGKKPVTGKSRVISSWILKGLKHVNLSGKRFFRAEDIVSFFDGLFEGSEGDEGESSRGSSGKL
ncbi:hypothetical protein ACFL2W_00425 [Candidatus Omnitrophota bacterium]